MSDFVPQAIIIQISARICPKLPEGGYSPDSKENMSKIIVLEAKNLAHAKSLLESKIEGLKCQS